jgi:hypothetical protein
LVVLFPLLHLSISGGHTLSWTRNNCFANFVKIVTTIVTVFFSLLS